MAWLSKWGASRLWPDIRRRTMQLCEGASSLDLGWSSTDERTAQDMSSGTIRTCRYRYRLGHETACSCHVPSRLAAVIRFTYLAVAKRVSTAEVLPWGSVSAKPLILLAAALSDRMERSFRIGFGKGSETGLWKKPTSTAPRPTIAFRDRSTAEKAR